MGDQTSNQSTADKSGSKFPRGKNSVEPHTKVRERIQRKLPQTESVLSSSVLFSNTRQLKIQSQTAFKPTRKLPIADHTTLRSSLPVPQMMQNDSIHLSRSHVSEEKGRCSTCGDLGKVGSTCSGCKEMFVAGNVDKNRHPFAKTADLQLSKINKEDSPFNNFPKGNESLQKRVDTIAIKPQNPLLNLPIMYQKGRRRRTRNKFRLKVYVVRDSKIGPGSGGRLVSDLKEFKNQVMRLRNSGDWTLVLAIHGSEDLLAAQAPPNWKKTRNFINLLILLVFFRRMLAGRNGEIDSDQTI